MLGNLNRISIESMWNNSPYDFVCNDPSGKYGGILAVWDTTFFTLIDTIVGNGFLVLLGKWCNIDPPWTSMKLESNRNIWGTIFDPRGASLFNQFIYSSDLLDLPLEHSEFPVLAKASWALPTTGPPVVGFKNKLKRLKLEIKKWRIKIQHAENTTSYELRMKIDNLDNKAERSSLSPCEVELRTSSMKQFANIELLKVNDLRQKAKLHWAAEDEIKEADWSCGSSKALGPNGYTFKFFKKHWSILEHDVVSYVVASVVGDVQMAYIKGRQIIDGPFMVEDIIAWAKKAKKRLMILKVDFEKAFDSLNWSFLFSILEKVGFSAKWRNWIHSCLNSAYASVLVNGSPTKEFKIERGLRQGDPLSPFLFILAVEALNVVLLEATNNNIFYGFI
ncbi:putative RNA-directed DNA polymerase, eukaryota, reverse transcriptase zinc-binding domain protein [Tanacetum coccineum]